MWRMACANFCAVILLAGCSAATKAKVPDKQQLLKDILGSEVGSMVDAWRFGENAKYIRFNIIDQSIFEKEAVLSVDAAGLNSNGRECMAMKFKATYRLDSSNTWKFIGVTTQSWRDIASYDLNRPECQA